MRQKAKHMYRYRLFFIFGSSLIIFAFTLLPLAYSFVLSLQNGRGSHLKFAGISNYASLLTDSTFSKALFNTSFFAAITVPIVFLLSIFLANAVNSIKSERIKSICSVILFFPAITSPVAYAYFFRNMFAVDGFLNDALINLNIISVPHNFLLTISGSRLAIIIVCIWAWTGYYTLLLISGLQSVDPTLYKAAKIDGANGLQILFRVTLPSIKPLLLFSSVLLSGGVFQLFAEIMIISRGGPEESTLTLAYYIYRLCFEYVPQFGYAATIALFIFVISALISIAQLKTGEMNDE